MPLAIDDALIVAFRKSKGEFCSQKTWPKDVITDALCEADAETGGRGWGAYQDICSNFKQRGVFFYAAHYLKVTYPRGAEDTSKVSSTPQYAVSSKSVGDESISFDTSALSKMNIGDSWLASTNYGQQYMHLRKRAGSGARAV